MNFGAVVFPDIKLSDMSANGARKSQTHARRSTGIVEAAVMRYLRVDQFDHFGAVAGLFVLTEDIYSIPEFDKNTGRAPLGAHRLVVGKYGPGHGVRRSIKMHGRHLVAIRP